MSLRGRITTGERWVSRKWETLLIAHAGDVPDLAGYHPGTLNVTLDELWCVPDGVWLRRRAHERGMRLGRDPRVGADFLANGNFIHPNLRVAAINDHPVEGRLYFPGIGPEEWEVDSSVWDRPIVTDRIEILSRVACRPLLRLGHDEELAVEVKVDPHA